MRRFALIAAAALMGCGAESPTVPNLDILETAHAAEPQVEAATVAPAPEPTPEATPEPPNPFPPPTPAPPPPGPECEWIAQPAPIQWDDWGPCVSDHGDGPCVEVRTGWSPLMEQNSCTVEMRFGREDHRKERECVCPLT